MLKASDEFGAVSAPPELFRFYLQGFGAGVNTTASLVVAKNEFSGSDGNSNDLSWPEDRSFLSALRRNSQMVVTTGKTARAEGLRKPKTARLAIITNSKDLSGSNLDLNDSELTILSGQDYPWEYLDMLRAGGQNKLQVEFGPSTMEQTWNSGRIDLLCVSSIEPAPLEHFKNMEQVFEIKLGKGRVTGFRSGVATGNRR